MRLSMNGGSDYRFLGADKQPASHANLERTLVRLRALAPAAPVDDRVAKPGFVGGLPLTSCDPVDLALYLVTLARTAGFEKAANKETLSFEERVRKAEKLFAEKKWAEAAAAFRALLAQAPSNPAAKTWRERVAAADQAQEQARAAKTRKAVSQDPLDGM